MKLDDVLNERRSCRKYLKKKIGNDIAEQILWAGERAPYASGGPRRDVICVVGVLKDRLQKACCNQRYVGECSMAFVVCGKDERILKSGIAKHIHDCIACAMCMDLKAVDLGLGTCWIGHFRPEEVMELLGCEKPVIILLVGWRNDE